MLFFFLHIKSSPNFLFGVLCLPGDQSHPFAQPTINPLARCICWAGLLGRAVFPPWNEGPNFGSYKIIFVLKPFPKLAFSQPSAVLIQCHFSLSLHKSVFFINQYDKFCIYLNVYWSGVKQNDFLKFQFNEYH